MLGHDGLMVTSPRWFTDTKEGHSSWYIERFRTMAAEGADLAGEARLIDAMVPPASRVLDAGCGPGRVAGELHRRGHRVWGVDVDPELIAAAEVDHPGPSYAVGDLSELELDAEPFDIAVCAGNVMVFLAAGSEQAVIARIASHVRPGGRLVFGFRRSMDYSYEAFDVDAATSGVVLEQRFGTWELDPFDADSDFAVSVLRVPGG